MEEVANQELPRQYGFDWTDLAFQEKPPMSRISGISALRFVCLADAFGRIRKLRAFDGDHPDRPDVPAVRHHAIWFRHMDNNIFTQIGSWCLAGMSVKNAPSDCRVRQAATGTSSATMKAADAAIEAARLRLRPILMTSFAFIFGVIPLDRGDWRGRGMRQALGTVVFFGMIGVTFFGIFLTPASHTLIRRLTGERHEPLRCRLNAAPSPAIGKTPLLPAVDCNRLLEIAATSQRHQSSADFITDTCK